ncbi:hypothetical protein ONZ45_g15372 [Pleurotus djamor]|nr:hypothetical protein ONZ45_g15372 [Pleurotus djamor]
MHPLLPLSLLLTVLDAAHQIHAVKIPFQVRTLVGPSSTVDRLGRRATNNVPIKNIHNSQYVSNITIAGKDVALLLDTGRCNKPFPKEIPQTTDTGKQITLRYAIGKAEGHIRTAPITVGNFTINDQAFLLVEDTSTFSGDIHAQGYDGLIGFGPNDGSVIKKKLKDEAGDNVLANIFQQNTTNSNYITLLLDRKGDPQEPFTGQMTISELVSNYTNVTSMPKLDVKMLSRLLESDQHWQAVTDKDNGIIGPDGQVIKMSSIVPKAPKGTYVGVVDSGFTFSQVPRDVSDAIYGRVQGAQYDVENEYWTVPCGQYIPLSFRFGGIEYPVHPLDVVNDDFALTDKLGKRVCIGAFQPITSAFSLLGNYDMILGMSFLRNVYSLLDYGNWVEHSKDEDDPYIQMLPLTNVAEAKASFIQIRLGGTDSTADPKWALLPVDQMQHSPVSEAEKKKKYQEAVLSQWPYILLGKRKAKAAATVKNGTTTTMTKHALVITLNVLLDITEKPLRFTQITVAPDLSLSQLRDAFLSQKKEYGMTNITNLDFATLSPSITLPDDDTLPAYLALLDLPEDCRAVPLNSRTWNQLLKEIDHKALQLIIYDSMAPREVNVYNVYSQQPPKICISRDSDDSTATYLRSLTADADNLPYHSELRRIDIRKHQCFQDVIPVIVPGYIHIIDISNDQKTISSSDIVISTAQLAESRRQFFIRHKSVSPSNEAKGLTNLDSELNRGLGGRVYLPGNPSPPTLYDETLCQLRYDVHHIKPEPNDYQVFHRVREVLNKAYHAGSSCERNRNNAFSEAIREVFPLPLVAIGSKGSTTHHSAMTVVDGISFMHMCLEFKGEFVGISSDPRVQCARYWYEHIRTLCGDDFAKYNHMNFPIILVSVVGSLMYISAGTAGGLKGHPSVENLANIDFALHPNNDEGITAAARTIAALRRATHRLEAWYPELVRDHGHQALFPFPSSFHNITNDGDLEHFTYTSNVPNKRVYFANGSTGRKLVVKFSSIYSKEAHIKAAQLHLAPKLLGYERHGEWHMIVMEDLSSNYMNLQAVIDAPLVRNLNLRTIYDHLHARLRRFHEAKYVHGDIRSINILVSSQFLKGLSSPLPLGSMNDELDNVAGFALLVDFDWAGLAGEVTYPWNINPEVIRPFDAKIGTRILADHDIQMLNQEFSIR